MTAARASIDTISLRLAEELRAGLARDRVRATVALAGARSLAARPARPRLDLVLHRINPDTRVRSSSIPRPGEPGAESAVRLGYILIARAPAPADEQRIITSAVHALMQRPVLEAGEAGPWSVAIEPVSDELRFACFAAMRIPLCPSVWCDVSGVIG